MRFDELKDFIRTGTEKWELIKKDLSQDSSTCARLPKSGLLVIFDDCQLELGFIDTLYAKTWYEDSTKPTHEELAREAFRTRMVEYFENDLKELFLEVRFEYLDIGLIQKIKKHKETIHDQQWDSPASIRVVVNYKHIDREEEELDEMVE